MDLLPNRKGNRDNKNLISSNSDSCWISVSPAFKKLYLIFSTKFIMASESQLFNLFIDIVFFIFCQCKFILNTITHNSFLMPGDHYCRWFENDLSFFSHFQMIKNFAKCLVSIISRYYEHLLVHSNLNDRFHIQYILFFFFVCLFVLFLYKCI